MGNVRNPSNGFALRLMAAGIVLYWYYQIVKLYLNGGEEAPSLLLLILSGVLMVGGALAVGIMSYRLYRTEKAQQEADARDAASAQGTSGEENYENSES